MTYRLAAVIISVHNTLLGLSRLVEHARLGDQAPEGVRAALDGRAPAVVDGRVVVPAGALEQVRRVEGRVHVERRRAVAEGRGAVDAEAVAVGADAQDDLVRGHAGGDPGLDARGRGALVVARVAGGRERGVGAGGGGPAAEDVVVLLGEWPCQCAGSL